MVKKKTYLIADYSYEVRENIGFWRGNKTALKKKLILLTKDNYGYNLAESKKYVNNYMMIKQIGDMSDAKLGEEYAEGLNWMGDLKKAKIKK